jgi:hypothetical protein
MTEPAMAFALYMASPELASDLDILMRAGRVQASAARDGADTPSGWFARAAESYTGDDRVGIIAGWACRMVSRALAEERPS